MMTRGLHPIRINIPTVEAKHNGWHFTVGIDPYGDGWANLITTGRKLRLKGPAFLLRKRPGVWCEPGTNTDHHNISETLEAAFQQLEGCDA